VELNACTGHKNVTAMPAQGPDDRKEKSFHMVNFSTALWKFRSTLLPAVAAASLLVLLPPAQAQVPGGIDPPGRVARMNLADGPVSYAPADARGNALWTPASLNRPLTAGDRLWTGQRARSELHIGSTAVRMAGQTSLDFLGLDDDTTQLRLAQGTVRLRVRNLFDGQRIEINTPNLAFVLTRPGDYRIDVVPATSGSAGSTRVVVQSGAATVYGAGGASLNLAGGQQANFTDTQLTPAGLAPEVQDGFDAWAADRDRREDRSVSARYIPREVIGYQQLDTYGDWSQDPTYGAVWLPRAVPANWAPYRAGHWSWIDPWGWTWIDDAPWGFAPFHYGRWAQIGPRWGWVPGQLAPRPVYAPALVAFIGGRSGGVNWNIALGQQALQQPGLGWFPLAPGEAFRPAYRVSPRYVTEVNHNIVVNNYNTANNYRYQRQSAAVSALSAADFARGQPVRPGIQRLSPADLGRAQLLAPERGLPEHLAHRRDEGRDNLRIDGRQNPPDPRFAGRPDQPRGDVGAGRPGELRGERPLPVLPAPSAQQDRNARDVEQRARFDQQRQQERQQRELARQQQEQARIGLQRPPNEESLGQRALRERAQYGANPNGPAPSRQQARPDGGRDPQEQAWREQQRLLRDQPRQQLEAVRAQEQQRRQDEASLGQRAMREQAQRQAQEQQAQQVQQAQQRALQDQQRAQQDQARQQQAQQPQLQQQQRPQRAQQDQPRGAGPDRQGGLPRLDDSLHRRRD
jgi:hypothetical protein